MTVSTPPLVPAQRAVFARLKDGEGVIVDTATAFYYGLNRTGVFLWESLGGQGSAGAPGVPGATGPGAVRPVRGRHRPGVPQRGRVLGQLEQYGLLVRTSG